MIPALHQAALDRSLRGRRLSVYLYLCTQLDTHQFRPIKITALARLLGIKRSHLSESITYLLNAGYLDAKQDSEDERRRSYRLFHSRNMGSETGRNHAA